eukprot:jgi/Botrbrau1/23452/Bobra.106_1s0010.2
MFSSRRSCIDLFRMSVRMGDAAGQSWSGFAEQFQKSSEFQRNLQQLTYLRDLMACYLSTSTAGSAPHSPARREKTSTVSPGVDRRTPNLPSQDAICLGFYQCYATLRTEPSPSKADTNKSSAAREEKQGNREICEGDRAQRAAALASKLPTYSELEERCLAKKQGKTMRAMSAEELDAVQLLLRGFQKSAVVRNKALAIYVNAQMWNFLSSRFVDFLMHVMDRELATTLTAIADVGETELYNNALFPYFMDFVLDKHKEEAAAYRNVVQTVDMRQPWQWYPVARSVSRRLIYHAGPTNSGKTHNALEAFKQAKNGIYCGPLRLLAMEVYDRMNSEGIYCNLVTGQERKEVPGAQHTACTIETVPVNQRVDVAIIDEVQMLGDESRGWAWTRALQGIVANEVHLCGDGSAVNLVRRMAKDMKEPLEVRFYDRFSPLRVETGTMRNGYMDVQPGDCIVAFSRKDIFDIKASIEREKGFGVCVVYGALPPEMRRQQARLFNDSDNDYKVLVASDAVGMGLNLNIRRVIFHRLDKWEGESRVPISVSQIKQIAGRAGRRGSAYPEGIATTLNLEDLPRLQQALATPLQDLSTPQAGLFPEFDMVEAFASKHLSEDYAAMLVKLGQEAHLDGLHFFCRQDSILRAARHLAHIPLSLQERHWFCNAPVNQRDARQMGALLRFAELYSQKRPILLELPQSRVVPTNFSDLQTLESLHQVVSLYLWLSNRFDEELFPLREHAESLSDRYINLMDAGLKAMYGQSMGLRDPVRKLGEAQDVALGEDLVGAAA